MSGRKLTADELKQLSRDVTAAAQEAFDLGFVSTSYELDTAATSLAFLARQAGHAEATT